MRFADALIRLAALREPLPEPPRILEPVVLRTPGQPPPWAVRAASLPVREAAVLVLLFPGSDGEAHVVLTVRPTGDLRHSGQISFPGGARDPLDDYPMGTALREAAEEVSLDATAAGVEIVGRLGPVDLSGVSGFCVVPVVAIARREPALAAHDREVAAILRVPVACFLPDAPIRIVESEREGWHLRYGAYPVGDHLVWGATARMLGQLGAVLSGHQGSPSVSS